MQKWPNRSRCRFGRRSRGLKEPYITWEGRSPRGRGNFGVVRAIQKHWQSSMQQLLQRRCRVRCKRDHSTCQASANSIMKFLGAVDVSIVEGAVELHSASEVWYLRLPCFIRCLRVFSLVGAAWRRVLHRASAVNKLWFSNSVNIRRCIATKCRVPVDGWQIGWQLNLH